MPSHITAIGAVLNRQSPALFQDPSFARKLNGVLGPTAMLRASNHT